MLVLGSISGTSMDGIDVALLDTDGAGTIRALAGRTYPYDAALRALTPAARRDAKRSQVDEFLAKMRDFFGLG